jgi:hypothetical protein
MPGNHHALDGTPSPDRRDAALAILLFIILTGIYHANRTFQHADDSLGNVLLAENITRSQGFTMAGDWLLQRLCPRGEMPYCNRPLHQNVFLVTTTTSGQYGNTFGIVPALLVYPVYSLLERVVGTPATHPLRVRLIIGKLLASLITAASAIFFYLALRLRLGRTSALMLTLLLALATPYWSLLSQAYLQQAAGLFWLCLGMLLFFVGLRQDRIVPLLGCALALGLAAATRSTHLFIIFTCAAYLFIYHRNRTFPFLCLAAVPMVLLLISNHLLMGDALLTPQAVKSTQLASELFTFTSPWETPLLAGLGGLLISPGRGLFVYSPIFLALAALCWSSYRRALPRPYWPFLLAAPFYLVTGAKWFDWWGGYTYGPRMLADILPLLVLALVPLATLPLRRSLCAALVLLFLTSVSIHGLGAFSYNMQWDITRLSLPKTPPTDRREIWLRHDAAVRDWSDSPIEYYLRHFSTERARNRANGRSYTLACEPACRID